MARNGEQSGPTPAVRERKPTGRGVKDSGKGGTTSITMAEQRNKGTDPKSGVASCRELSRKVSANSGGEGFPDDVNPPSRRDSEAKTEDD